MNFAAATTAPTTTTTTTELNGDTKWPPYLYHGKAMSLALNFDLYTHRLLHGELLDSWFLPYLLRFRRLRLRLPPALHRLHRRLGPVHRLEVRTFLGLVHALPNRLGWKGTGRCRERAEDLWRWCVVFGLFDHSVSAVLAFKAADGLGICLS